MEIPKIVENRVSLKSMTLSALNSCISVLNDLAEQNNLRVVLLTPSGIIKGKIVPVVEIVEGNEFLKQISPENSSFEADISFVYALRQKTLIEWEKENPNLQVVDNGAFINLKDVELTSPSTPGIKNNFSQLIVFVDQIVGFSLTNQ